MFFSRNSTACPCVYTGANTIYHVYGLHLEKAVQADKDVFRCIQCIIHELFPKSIVRKMNRQTILLFGGNISSDIELARIFYSEFVQYIKSMLPKRRFPFLYAVLGESEMQFFDKDVYQEMFHLLRIIFLDNTCEYCGMQDEIIRITHEDTPLIVGGSGLPQERQLLCDTYTAACQLSEELGSSLILLSGASLPDFETFPKANFCFCPKN